MEKLIKINNENYPEIYDKELDKYIMINENKDIVGIATINALEKVNKIKINVLDEYRGNGYGKDLFKKVLEEYKANYDNEDLRFEINGENKFNSIIYQFGGINISNNNGNLVYILPLK